MADYDLQLKGKGWHDLSGKQQAELLSCTPNSQLEAYAADPGCNQRMNCKAELRRRGVVFPEENPLPEPRPFDPRTEVSADARFSSGRIVTHLWVILVVLPFVLAILYEILVK